MLSAYERERLVIGQVLLFEYEAAKLIWPHLNADKFVFSMTGALGSKEHSHIWSSIELCLAKRKSPNEANVLEELGTKYGEQVRSYIRSVRESISGYYRIRTLDEQSFMELAERVDKAGVIYNTLAYRTEYSKILENPTEFQSFADSIDDVDEWLSGYISGFRSSVKNGPEGYEHISDVVARARQQWDSFASGESSPLLPIGIPSITRHGLFLPATVTTIHGMSSMGKTAFANQVCLGTAIGLQKNNIPGCVAINSMEMTETSLLERMASLLSGFNRNKLLQGPSALQGEDYQQFLQAADYVATLPIYIDTTNLIKTSVLEYRISGIHSSDRGPVRMLLTDYMELFGDSDADNKEQNLNLVIRNQLSIARQLKIAVITISQSTYGDGDNKARIAGAGGVRYSQAIRHATDDLMEIWNPPAMKRAGIDYRVPEGLDDSHFWLFVQKRREAGGIPEPIPFFWEGEYTRIIDPELSYGRNDPVVFDHFLEKREIKSIVPAVSIGSNGHGDWSMGLEGSF